MRTGGEKLFLDFAGDTMGYVDMETGDVVQCQAFVATLPASDYGYILFVRSQPVPETSWRRTKDACP